MVKNGLFVNIMIARKHNLTKNSLFRTLNNILMKNQKLIIILIIIIMRKKF
jgi:hypothetical protein